MANTVNVNFKMEAKLEYMKWYRNKYLSAEEMAYLKSIRDDEAMIEELFGSDLNFGTAGMRGIMGVGMSRINKYQIARATQAFSNDLIRKAGGRVGKGIAVCFDTRHMSEEFSDTVVRVLLGNGIGTALFLAPKSVAQLSFAIRYLDLEGGIMITASHNPKEYNGFKVYNNRGAQMTPQEMEGIISEFRNITEFFQIHSYVGYLRLNSIHHKIGIANDFKYRNAVLKAALNDDFDVDLKIVYSPIHGTGAVCVPELLKERGFKNVYTVKEQMTLDGDFPTVKSPNPEDPASLEMSIKLAQEKAADIVLATDPDCDRVGLAVRDASGEYKILTGNQTGALIMDYIANYRKDMPENPVMVKTVVTSNFGKMVAEKANIAVKETLTGFKYIGQFVNECEDRDDLNFVFGYEESCGFLTGTHARDKDGANGCMIISEMAATYKKKGMSLIDRLNELYDEFGYFSDSLKEIYCEGADCEEQMEVLMDKVRMAKLESMAGEPVAVTDFLNDETGLPKENAIKFDFANGSFVAVRPSGTEPKLKIYFSVRGKDKAEAEARRAELEAEIEAKLAK